MLTQSSHPILISCVMPVLEQLKSESAFLYLVFFIIFYTQFFHNLTFTYYSIVITIHLSNLPFPLIHWWYNHEVHTQESPDPGDKFFRSRGSLPRPLHTNTNPCENWIPLPLVAPLQTLQTQTYCLVWNPFKKQGLPLTQGYFRLE